MSGDLPVFVNVNLRATDDGTYKYYGEKHPPLPYGVQACNKAIDDRDVDLLRAVVEVITSGPAGRDVRVGVGTSVFVTNARPGKTGGKSRERDITSKKHIPSVGWDSNHISVLWLRKDSDGSISGVYVDEAMGGNVWESTRTGAFYWKAGAERTGASTSRFFPDNQALTSQWQQKLDEPRWNQVCGETHSSLVAAGCLLTICLEKLGVKVRLSTAPGCQSARGYNCFPASIAGILVHALDADERATLDLALKGHEDYVEEKLTILGDRSCGSLLTRLVERHIYSNFPDVEVHASHWEYTTTTGTAVWAQACCVCGQQDRADVMLIEKPKLRHEFCSLPTGRPQRSTQTTHERGGGGGGGGGADGGGGVMAAV